MLDGPLGVGGRSLSVEPPWRRLPFFRGATAEALAGVEALMAGLAAHGRPAMRWYIMEHPALILGSSQRLAEVDFAACEAAGVTVHRRRSGGTVVYSDASLLSLDVGLPGGHRLLPQDITKAYRWFGEVWREALATLGIQGRVIADAEARLLNASLEPAVKEACFGGVSPYEVMIGERKLVGLAQVRRRPGGLLQAGIYAHWRPGLVSNLLSGSEEHKQRRAELLGARACGLDELTGSTVTLDDVVAAWERALTEIEGVGLAADDWSDEEGAAAAEAEARYAALNAAVSIERSTDHGVSHAR